MSLATTGAIGGAYGRRAGEFVRGIGPGVGTVVTTTERFLMKTTKKRIVAVGAATAGLVLAKPVSIDSDWQAQKIVRSGPGKR